MFRAAPTRRQAEFDRRPVARQLLVPSRGGVRRPASPRRRTSAPAKTRPLIPWTSSFSLGEVTVHRATLFQKIRIPGESRDPLSTAPSRDKWIPAFAGNAAFQFETRDCDLQIG